MKTLQNYIKTSLNGSKKVAVAVPLREIVKVIKSDLDNTPLINVHGALMGVKQTSEIPTYQDLMPIKGDADLKSWAKWYYQTIWTGSEVRVPGTNMKTKPVGWSELKSALSSRIPHHKAVEMRPHYPPIHGHYYLKNESEFKDGDGSTLGALVEKFNGETPEDNQLIKAMILTAFWGGEPGSRPAFLITSDHGRGVGKSTTVEIVAEICGGLTQVDSERESASGLARKLGTPEEIPKPVVLIDNIKKMVDSARYEAMITARQIAADRLYHGAFQPPNVKVWAMTLNGPSASTDIASRSIVIKIGRPPHEKAKGSFKADIFEFIRDNKRALFCDILGELRSDPQVKIDQSLQTRWSGWQQGILTRFDNGNDLARLIQLRRGEIDTEAQESEDLIHLIKTSLSANGIDPESQSVCIPYGEIVDPIMEYFDERSRSARKFWAILKPYFPSSAFREYGALKGRSGSRVQRGLVWQPDPDDTVLEWDEAKEAGKKVSGGLIGLPSTSSKASTPTQAQVVDDDQDEDQEVCPYCGDPTCTENYLCGLGS